MWRWNWILLLFALVPGVALAQPVPVPFGPPMVRWEVRPPMVLVAPGFWVVEDSPDEVFYSGEWYWTLQGGRWYRSRDHRGHWGEVPVARVPARFHAREAGHYRHYRSEARPARHDGAPAPAYQPARKPGKPAKARGPGRGKRRARRST